MSLLLSPHQSKFCVALVSFPSYLSSAFPKFLRLFRIVAPSKLFSLFSLFLQNKNIINTRWKPKTRNYLHPRVQQNMQVQEDKRHSDQEVSSVTVSRTTMSGALPVTIDCVSTWSRELVAPQPPGGLSESKILRTPM
jgi:hypothetical protein